MVLQMVLLRFGVCGGGGGAGGWWRGEDRGTLTAAGGSGPLGELLRPPVCLRCQETGQPVARPWEGIRLAGSLKKAKDTLKEFIYLFGFCGYFFF